MPATLRLCPPARDIFVTACLMTAVFAAPANAQVVGANLSGAVTDDSGAALPGVTVTINNKANGTEQAVVTTAEGTYRVVALQPAPYVVSAELAGFGVQRRE